MLYVNQIKYEHIPFNHRLGMGEPERTKSNVRKSGCGPSSLCMILEHLTTETISVEDCVKLVEECGATQRVGTDMKIAAPVFAERFGLDYSTTDDIEELRAHLAIGGEAVIHVGGDHDGKVGLFTHGGHYMVALSMEGDIVCILDPSYRPGKFDEEGRQGRVKVCEPFVYCHTADLLEGTSLRHPGFHLFKRKVPSFDDKA